jgi:hypothetical protein
MKQANAKLRSTLGAKSSWVFNCNKINQKLKTANVEGDRLFLNTALNDVVIIKEILQGDDPRRADDSPIGTKLYLPYEPESPERGGRSIQFDSPDVLPFLQQTVGLTSLGDHLSVFEHDFKILATINQLPSMDGFLMRDALALKGIFAHEAYFEVSPEERAAIQSFIRKKNGDACAGGFRRRQATRKQGDAAHRRGVGSQGFGCFGAFDHGAAVPHGRSPGDLRRLEGDHVLQLRLFSKRVDTQKSRCVA